MDTAASTQGDARGLAADLATRDDAELQRLFDARGVPPTAPWRDFFDAAEALLAPASIDRALSRLPRWTLRALAGDSPVTDARLLALALIGPDGAPHRAVAERIHAQAADRPDAFTAGSEPPPPRTASALDTATAAERAALSIAGLADVLLLALPSPLTRTGAGAVSAADRRRLMDAGAVSSPDELDELLEGGLDAGLLTRSERAWLVTAAGEEWLSAATAERWRVLAEGFRDALPAALRTKEGGFLPFPLWAEAYPLDPDWPRRCGLLARIAARWGLVAPSGAEPEWTAALRAGGTAETSSLTRLLPPEIDRIYLQADLSAISPGQLTPALDVRLRGMTVRESRAQASTYRFTAESIAAAVAAGETAESLRRFLSQLSLTGIPQPLDYLIERTASRHGLVRVMPDPGTGRTRVESDDPGQLDMLEVDQSVRAIGLVRDGDSLTSRVGRDAVYWTLVDARYPAVAVDATGESEPLQRGRLAPDAAAPAGAHARLIETLRHSTKGDADAAWLGRELDAAVRSRATVVVVAALPDGSTREFTLEASGLGGGRLRGRDRAADTERTLPVSSIVSVRPA